MAREPGAPGRSPAELPGILLVFWIVLLAQPLLWTRPDLGNPAQIGTDSSNYYAAGERLNAGHDLYQLQPGDRAVANGPDPNPWSYPLLSPPPIAVLWRFLALLPGDLSMYLWALGGLAASFIMVSLLIVHTRPSFYWALVLLTPFMAITACSGNVNAWLIPGCALAWWCSSTGRPVLAGFLIGLASVLKLTPALWIWWFVVRRDLRAFVACMATVGAVLIVSVICAGPNSFMAYVAVVREAGSVALPGLSPIVVATYLGMPSGLAHLVPYLLAGVAAAFAWHWRDRPSLAYAACAVGVTLGTPDLRMEVIGWLLLALVPLANSAAPRQGLFEARAASSGAKALS